MKSTKPLQPLIRPGWLRVLIFCIVYFVLLVLSAELFRNLIQVRSKGQAILPGNLGQDLERLSLLVVISLVAGVVAVSACRFFLDRRTFLGMGLKMENLADALSGFFLAIAILGTGTLILYFTKYLEWSDIIFNSRDLFLELGIMAFISFNEELVFRGYILNNLLESFNKWIALFISALLFMAFHVINPDINIIALVNIFLAGVLLGLNYIYTRNLWFAMSLHFAWNYVQGPLLGFKVSGLNFSTLLQADLHGDLLVTGGVFGFEGSVLDLALTQIAILLLYWVYERKFADRASSKEAAME